jgi:hypothetical protein
MATRSPIEDVIAHDVLAVASLSLEGIFHHGHFMLTNDISLLWAIFSLVTSVLAAYSAQCQYRAATAFAYSVVRVASTGTGLPGVWRLDHGHKFGVFESSAAPDAATTEL